MTPAATPEALAEALAEFQRRNGYHRPEIEELLMEFGELVLATATSELARLRAEGEALKADRDDAIRMLDVWFDTSTKTNEQVVPQLVDALVDYLRTCRCGGMPAETSDMIEAGAADFIRRRAGYIIAPVIEAMVAERTASLRAEGEAKDRAMKVALDAYDAAVRESANAEAVRQDVLGRQGDHPDIGEIMDQVGAEEGCMRAMAARGIARADLVAAVRTALTRAATAREGQADG